MPRKRAVHPTETANESVEPPAKKQINCAATDDTAPLIKDVLGKMEDGSIADDNAQQASSDNIREEIVNIRGQSKPSFVLPAPVASKSLHDRLHSFLPELAQSNERLASSHEKSMEEVEDEDEHIVMELGLGVLEEEKDDESDSDHTGSDTEAEIMTTNHTPTKTGEHHHMRRLLGERTAKKANIQEIV